MPEKATLFVMQQPATFWWPVKVPIPREGKYEFAEFMAEFPNLSEEEIQALLANAKDGTPTRKDSDVAAEVLKSFSGLFTPDGSELPFSDENKVALLRMPRAAGAVVSTFLLAVRGLAAQKNS